jgi:predicted nucleic acid-binding protein
MSAFWDASALVHVCVPGQISRSAKELVRTVPAVTWWATPVELRSALGRLHREGAISAAAFQASWRRMSGLLSGCTIVPPSHAVLELALAQLDRFPLKAGDALQLAAALVWSRQRPRGRLLICNDKQLLSAATAAGFEVKSV